MINLRQEFLDVLRTSGWNVYLQRRTSDDEWQFSNVLEKHTIRNRFASSSSATGLAREQMEGIEVAVDNVFYFKWDANPGEGDRIYEEFPNQQSKVAVWLIDYCQPFRGFGGQVIYWVAGCTREDTLKTSTATAPPIIPLSGIPPLDSGGVADGDDIIYDGGEP